MARMPLLGLAMLVLLAALSRSASADHNKFAYKWPFPYDTTGVLTTLPFQEEHACGTGSCTDAYDIDIVNAVVLSGSQGQVTESLTFRDPDSCDPAHGLGNFVRVQDNLLGSGLTASYGHFASVTSTGPFFYQGDVIGVQGHTGQTSCNDHLHWQFNPARPAFIDGLSAGSGDQNYGEITQTQVSHTSSNVILGDKSINQSAGEEVIVEYGVLNGWDTVGWVSDAGRGLPLHRHGDGWEQNFANHDDQDGIALSGIYVPDRVDDDAFWVYREFWDTYENVLGGATGFLRYRSSRWPQPLRHLSAL